MSDEVTLTVPAQEDFRQVTHLVVGGLGARLDLTYEDIDDLQTALDALLGRREDDGDIEVVVGQEDGSIRASVGPFSEGDLEELESDSPALGLRRVLETVSDGFEIERRDGSAWVLLTKRLGGAAG